MARTIMDGDLKRWEVYATSGDYGFSEPARVIFRCVSDPDERARAVVLEGDKSEAEHTVAERSDDELLAMFEESEVVD